MKQLTQKLKNGDIQVVEVPSPMVGPGMLLVRNYYSLISPGTEGSTVKAARKSLLGKAKERPEQAKQVIEVLKQRGPVQTYRVVMKKLGSYSPLGYSCAGEVVEIGDRVQGFRVGDLIACGGSGYANHAEIVAVPSNLCVKLSLSQKVERGRQNEEGLQKYLKAAAYNTVGAIALQGVRQADLGIGEVCAVIGLGLIGQLTCLILRAGGIKVVGIDIDSHMVEIASEHCADMALVRDEPGLAERIDEFTDSIGVDAVIIAAATRSTDPINLAGKIAREKGRVVIVGDVPTGFDREPYYKKELELRMSCSYGPGRYDPSYEEKGIDYPVGYVRWTENRNMKAFQELVQSGKIDVDYLTNHIFDLEDAPKAYDLILKKNEPFLGILIRYDVVKENIDKKVVISQKSEVRTRNSGVRNQKLEVGIQNSEFRTQNLTVRTRDSKVKSQKSEITNEKSEFRIQNSEVSIAFVGAGSYAMSHLLPNIPKKEDVALKAVITSSGTSSRTVAEKYKFEFCTSDDADIFNNDDISTVFIATRHNTHVEYVIKALQAGKHVFVEKPLCLTEEELNEIKEVYNSEVRIQSSEMAENKGNNSELRSQSLEMTSCNSESRRQKPEASYNAEGRRRRAGSKSQKSEGSYKAEGRSNNSEFRNQKSEFTNQTSEFILHTSYLPLLMLGFNRRFSSLAQILKERLGAGPMAMIYRINAGPIPSDSWIQDKDIGGGRIIGEVCHFVDFLTFINGSLPDRVFATAMQDPADLEDTLNVSVHFQNGSIGTISYFANGSKSLSKEYVEIYRTGMTAILNDFKALEIYGDGKPLRKRLFTQDKGQKKMVSTFVQAIKEGKPSPISFEEICAVTMTTFKIIESIRTQQAVEIG